MKIRFHLICSILLAALSSSWCKAEDVILDFGGVLIITDKIASFRNIGIINSVSCSIQLGINPLKLDQYITLRLFDLMTRMGTAHHIDKQQYHRTYNEKGYALPAIMCTWLQGTMTSAEVLSLIEKETNLHPEWFKCRAEKRILLNTLRLIFTPDLFVRSRKIVPAGIAFIKKCKREGHRVYGLSNWDADSFEILKVKHPELFDLFDGIVISAHAHANKPHATIYQTLLEQYQLDAENCWFIDDQKENIEAAQKLGINAIQHTSNFTHLIKNIRIAHSKSLKRRENLNNSGIKDSATNNNNNAMIEGEKISLTDSTKYNCLPANA